MDIVYSPNKSYCTIATRPMFKHDIVQTGGSCVSNPACYFGGFAVAEHAVDNPYPLQDPTLYRSALQPVRFNPTVSVPECYGTPLIDRMPCCHGVVGLSAAGQLVGNPSPDFNTFSRTQSVVAEPAPERLVLVHQKEASNVLRTCFTQWMKELLEASFSKCHYVSKKDKKQLAYDLQVTEKQIKIWFQNRRVKERKQLNRGRSRPAGRPPNVCPGTARESAPIMDKQPYRLICGDARELINSVAKTPLKKIHDMCQDIKPSLDNIGPFRDEQKGLSRDDKPS